MAERIPPPELRAVTAAFLAAAVKFVVVGGFAVIANRYVRATQDVDLLVPDDRSNDERCASALGALQAIRTRDRRPADLELVAASPHLRVQTDAGLVDLIREGEPPLDYATAAHSALSADLGDGAFLIAGLETIVAMKRLAGRPQDRNDLLALEAEHGELPIVRIPGLDS
ncbi:MAG: hypothetical protein H0U12_02410 [Thermoleophilaceae bacterium]|nr:hypothetical protein [Thermoleophilaceae bacterium]